jgi:hypothetical protein
MESEHSYSAYLHLYTVKATLNNATVAPNIGHLRAEATEAIRTFNKLQAPTRFKSAIFRFKQTETPQVHRVPNK